MKRLAWVAVSGEFLASLCHNKTKTVRVASSLPSTAKFHSAHYDYKRNIWRVSFSDDSFEEVPEGQLIPELDPITIHEIYDQKKIK